MNQNRILLSAFLLLPNLLGAQAKLIEKITKKSPTDVVIPYERYQLPNGMTVVLHEDHSDPLVHVDVTYHVGSAREEIGKSGFAHFFEHMMFQGSDNVADEQHFKIITEAGGTLNGTTNRDRTNYFETVPNNQLEKMLWLEADRMGFLVDAVTQKKFEVQRATVKNERGQNYDNRPYGLVQETLAKNLYPYGHPYSWLTIGYVEDLNRVDVQDLKNFFLRWYGPNNAVLTIGGDFKKAEVLKMVNKYFGSIPRGPEVKPTKIGMPVLAFDRYVSMTDQYAKNQMLTIALPTVPQGHADENAIDCLAQILGGDNSSILYQNLVKTQKATRATAGHPTDELAGTFQFSLMPSPKNTLADMEKAVREALVEFEKRGVKDEDISKFISGRQTDAISTLESVSGKVSTLASSFTFNGTPNHFAMKYKEISKLTKADIMRVYQQYIKGKPMVILNVLTKDKQEGRAGKDNYVVDTTYNNFEKINYIGLKYNKAKDNFDRSKMPGNGPNPIVKVPKFVMKEKVAPGNYKLLTCVQNEIPKISIEIALPGGTLLEQNDLSKAGLTSIYTQMMDEDTKKYTSEEISTLMDQLGSSVSIFPTSDKLKINIECLSKNLKPTMDLVREKILNPVFTEDNLSRIKNQTISGLKNLKNNPTALAGRIYNQVLYGEQHIFGKATTETEINNITLSDIENMHKNLSGKDAQVTIVGNFSPTDVTQIMQTVRAIPTTRTTAISFPKPKPYPNMAKGKKIVYMVDIPGAAQTEFRIGYLTDLAYNPLGDDYKATLMNFPLGGNFNSRINLNLREDKGWTYGARSGFNTNKYSSNFTFSSGIKKEATDSALVEVLKEMTNYVSEGITNDELQFMKKALGQSEARKYETLGQKVSFFSNMAYHNLGANYTVQQNEILQKMSAGQLNSLSNKYLFQENMFIVLAGDAAVIAPKVAQLGYIVVELDWLGAEKK